MANKLKYAPGDRIDLLTILSRGPNNGRQTQWYCSCDCGNDNILLSQRRFNKEGRKKPVNCGCLNKKQISELGKQNEKNLVGQTFGRLFVLEKTDKRECESIIYKCKCACGTICEVRSTNLRNGHTQSCGCLKSLGEFYISKILEENNIKFEKEKTFSSCVYSDSNRRAKFDFYINNKYLIEYDGNVHFKANGGWNNEENLVKIKKHDEIKNQWCKENNIPLIRISNISPKDITLKDLILETSNYIYTEV